MKRELVVSGFFGTVALIMLTGCGGPARLDAPEWDADSIADACMAQCDEDGDGFIDKKELKNAPGLEYASRQLDADKDKKLSRDEVLTRFNDYIQSKVGFQGFTCYVLYNNRPLIDGQIRLVPEPFLADFIEEAEGQVVDDRTGMAEVTTPNEQGIFGVRSGMYRVEITSDEVKVGKKYNEETTLGVEVAPFTNEFETPGGIKFKVGR